MKFENTLVFTDGACSGNPGPGGWGVVIALARGEVIELAGNEEKTTNNRMELMALIRALDELQNETADIDVWTDSVYVIRGATQWVQGWQRRGWVNAEGVEVANQDLWQEYLSVAKLHRNKKIHFHFVRGHTGIVGNERCDEMARTMVAGKWLELFRGPLKQYGFAIYDLPESEEPLPEMKPKNQAPKKAHSYLSLVGGLAQRHADWASCEARVKGVPGAKFKKAMTEEEEKAILASWGQPTGLK